MTHCEQRLHERHVQFTPSQLAGIAYECDCDTAVILAHVDFQGQEEGGYRSREESNGDLVVLIVRNHEPKTVMFRRSNQPLTPESMNVRQVLDLTH